MDGRLLLAIGVGYLLGSIPFAHLVARLHGIRDLRQVGSRNVGAGNVMRTVGRGWGFLAGVLDFAKGLAALALARALGAPDPLYLLAGHAAMLGHNYPLWLGFRGGKGAAVGIAIAAWVALPEAALGLAAGLLVFWRTRNVTFGVGSGFLAALALTRLTGRPLAASWAIAGVLAVLLLAIVPEAVALARIPGGLSTYLRTGRNVRDR